MKMCGHSYIAYDTSQANGEIRQDYYINGKVLRDFFFFYFQLNVHVNVCAKMFV